MNSPPEGGATKTSPSDGHAFNTSFLLSTYSWSDDASDYPLSYVIWYYTVSSSSATIVKTKDQISYTYARLAQGTKGSGYNITIVGNASDIYGSTSSASCKVRVHPIDNVLTLASDAGSGTYTIWTTFSTYLRLLFIVLTIQLPHPHPPHLPLLLFILSYDSYVEGIS
jgi:hypothetical protein